MVKKESKDKKAIEKGQAEEKKQEEKADKLGRFSKLRRSAENYKESVEKIIEQFEKIYTSHKNGGWGLPTIGGKIQLTKQGPVYWMENLIAYKGKIKDLKLDKRSAISSLNGICKELFGDTLNVASYIRDNLKTSHLEPKNANGDLPNRILSLAQRLKKLSAVTTWSGIGGDSLLGTLKSVFGSSVDVHPFGPAVAVLEALHRQCSPEVHFGTHGESESELIAIPLIGGEYELGFDTIEQFKADVDKFANDVYKLCDKHLKTHSKTCESLNSALSEANIR